tara:strand:- start:625 stop:1062 length:438 start_codon:yes stop_codon:yes gene_type:complete
MILKKRYNKGGKFSLKDLMQAYKATKPERGEYSFSASELGLAEGNAFGENETTFLSTLTPERQEELLESEEIDKIIERDGGALPTGGGGVTVIKADGSKKKFKGTEGGGTDFSYRKGTANPFKRIQAALLSLKKKPKKYANPRFL